MKLNELFTNLIIKVALTSSEIDRAFGNSLIEGSGLQLDVFGGTWTERVFTRMYILNHLRFYWTYHQRCFNIFQQIDF